MFYLAEVLACMVFKLQAEINQLGAWLFNHFAPLPGALFKKVGKSHNSNWNFRSFSPNL